MKKKFLFVGICMLASLSGMAQKKNFSYKFYGQVRADLFYNTRSNQETVDGLFNVFPKDVVKDAAGEDLNATPTSNLYMLYTRLGVDVKGPKIGKVATNAKVEMDFRGSGSSFGVLRLRHAYLNLAWDKGSSLLIGQTSYPFFGDVFPRILNLNTGSPYQPFGRGPQVRYRLKRKNFQLGTAFVWQSNYLSIGPDNKKSINYQKWSCVPDFYIGLDYNDGVWMAGVGAETTSLKPRTESVMNVDGQKLTYKVNERVNSVSYEAHLQYKKNDWLAAAKTTMASNMTHTCMMGGYGITAEDEKTGEREYTPLRVSSTWLNVTYGKVWSPGVFVGYAKNLGSAKKLLPESQLCGLGTNIDQLVSGGAELTYKMKHWKFGVEYLYTSAWYGEVDWNDGRVYDTHSVGNHRIVATAMFLF